MFCTLLRFSGRFSAQCQHTIANAGSLIEKLHKPGVKISRIVSVHCMACATNRKPLCV
jgi:hypothetical protein